MLITKSEVKKASKKLLSVFLVLIMIMSTMSVCFGSFTPVITAEAANGDGMDAFVAAVEAYGKAGYKFPALNYSKDESSKDTTSWVITKTWSYTPATYKEYELFRTVIKTLHTFVFNLDEYTVCKTHNSNNPCGDGWNSSTQANKCTDWGYVKDALITTLGSKYNPLKNYNVDNLLNAILNYDEVPMGDNKDGPNSQNALARPSNGNAHDYGSGSSNTKTPQRIWNDFVLKAPANAVSEIISNSATVNAIPATYSSELYYRLGTQQCAQSWKESGPCGGTKTGKYHMAIQDQSGKAPTTAPTDTNEDIDKSSLTAAQTAFGTTYKNYFATTDKNGVLAISKDETTLRNVKAAIESAKAKVVTAFGADVYDKYLSSYPYARTIKNIDDALTFLGFQTTIDEINRLKNVDYSSYNSTQLAGHLAALEEAYAGYKGLSDADKADILANYPYFKPAEVDAKIAEINAAYTRLLVEEKLDVIEGHLASYENKWTMVDVDNDILKYTEAYAAFLVVEQDYNTLKTLDKTVIADVAGADFYGRVETLYTHLANLATGAQYNEQYTPMYKEFNSTVKNVVPTSDVDSLLSALKSYDSWYSSLKALIDAMSANLAEEDAKLLFDEMDTAMKDHMDKAYAALNGRVETQINLAYDLYTAHKAIYGPTVHYVSLESYQIVTESIGRIDVPAYEFMKSTPNFEFSAETVRRYEEMAPLVYEFEKFANSMGFDTFYELKMADYEREDDPANESFRVNTNKDEDSIGEYITTDAQIAKVIKVIDTALTDPSVAGALGLDLGTMLTDLVEGAIISDSFINTVVNLLYPLVLKEFGKVFANDLPKEASGFEVTYGKGLHEVFRDAGFEVYPDLLATELGKSPRAASYADTIKRLNDAYTEAKTKYPNVGAKGNDAYLTKTTPDADGKYALDKCAWDSDALYETVLDDNGNPVIDEATGEVKKVFALTWGIDAAKEAGLEGDDLKELFYQTFDDAVEGLKPLLLALIANKGWFAEQDGMASAMSGGVQVGLELSASANSGYANLLVPIYEALGVSYTSVSDVETVFTNDTNTKASQDAALIVKAILEPIFTLVGRIGDAPLDTILGILPNLCYALQAGMVTPLLSMLKTRINYLAPVSCSMVTSPSGGVDIDVGTMLDIPILDDINRDGLNALLTLLGIEGLPPINQALIACLGELTQIKTQRKEAVYSSEKLANGYAYHVVANKADVLSYLAEYLLTAIGQPGVLDALMGLFAPKAEAPAEGEEGTTPEEGGATEEETSDLLTDILSNISTNPRAAIAAIVELLNFNEYQTKMLYDWYNGTNYEASTVVGFNPATEIYLDVDNDWTREKAEYLYTNLETIINAVIAMLPVKEEAPAEGEETPDAPETAAEGDEVTEEVVAAKTLKSLLGDLIGGLYSDATLTALAATLGKLDLNALLAGDAEETPAEGEETPDVPETVAEGDEATEEDALDINALINNLLGINLGQFATLYGNIAELYETTKDSEEPYVAHSFGIDAIEDAAAKKTAFVNKLVEMLAPLNKVLDFLLTGGDLTVFDGEAKVTLYGGDGYNTAIIPLLEALGCTPVAATTGSDALKATLNALVAKIDALTADPVATIFDLLDGLVYFLTSNGLSTAAQNLLKPALVLIETIRPIIDVMDILNNLGVQKAKTEVNEAGEEVVVEEAKTLADLLGGELNLKALDANFVIDLVSGLIGLNLTGLKTIFYDVAAALTVKTYTSASTLQTEWKTAEFNTDFDQVDLLTVLLSFVVEWIAVPENGAAIDKLAKKEGIGAAIANIIKGAEFTYETPNWMYFFNTKEEFLEAVANGMVIPSTLAALQYPNDWNRETAAYIADNLPELVDMIIGLINNEKTDEEGNALPTTLSALLTDLIGGVFSAETLNTIVGLITGLLENVADELLAAGGYLLDVNLVGLKSYEAKTEDVTDINSFASELATVLTTYAPGIVELLFLGGDYRFFNTSDGKDSIVISGGNGYAEGLALILEALGCENLPVVYGADGEVKADLDTVATVEAVFASLATRINDFLANPVEEILELLPNLIFFLNANGAGVALGNLLKPVNAILDSINALLAKPISLSDLLTIKIYEKDENGNIVKDEEGKDKVEKEIAIDLANLSLANVVTIVEGATDLDLAVVEDILVNFCVGKIVSYDSVSVNDAYKMTEFAQEDVVTIILTIALLFVQNEDNAKALDELIGQDIIGKIKAVFESVDIKYMDPEWYALDWNDVDYESKSVGVVQSALTYPNDWTAEKSLYLADNLSSIVDTVIGMIEINGVKYESLADLIDANVNIYTPDLFTTIQNALGGLLDTLLVGDVKTIVEKYGFDVVESLLDADIQGLLDYDASYVNDKATFVAALTDMLMEVEGIVEWLLLGEDYAFFVDTDSNDIITLNGAEGYAQGLSLVLEALGVKDLPAATGETREIVNGVLKAVFNRVDEILANPVNEVINILPNVIYFINTNGLAAAVNNLAAAFNSLALKLKAFGLNITLADLLNIESLLKIYEKNEAGEVVLGEDGKPVVKDLAIGLDKLNLTAVLEVVTELTGLDLTGVADIFVGFALGRVYGYTGVNGKDNAKMAYDEGEKGRFNKGDMITLIVTAALLVVNAEGNAEKLDALLKTNGIVAAIKAIIASNPVVDYATPNWNYMNGKENDDVIEYVNAIVEYPNDWTEAKAKYLADNLPALVDTVIQMVEIKGEKYESLSKLLETLLADSNIFTAKTLNDLVDLIAGLLGDIDDGLLSAAGVLLGADIVGLKAYKAPETVDTVDEFATELANILNTYAKGVVEWLLLGRDYRFFVSEGNGDAKYDYGEDAITINGAHGYAEGLALLLEALGCENLPTVYDTVATTEDIVSGVLASLAKRIDEIIANPVEEVLDLLPNLIYFLDANGVAVVIENTTAALVNIIGALEPFNVKLDINSLVDLPKLMGIADKYEEGEKKIGLDNLTLVALLRAVSLMTGLDLTELQNVLVPFALGEAKKYESVSKFDAYKMVYKTDLDKHDMITVIVTAALRAVVENEDNAAKLDEMLGTDIISALKEVFAEGTITYTDPDWDYCWDENGDATGETIPVIESALTYPNDWTAEKSDYLVKNLPALVDMVVQLVTKDDEATLAKILEDNVNVFTAKTLNDLVALITDLLGDIDSGLLEAAGIALDVKLVGDDSLSTYVAPETVDTVDEFAAELAYVLNTYAKGVVEWLLIGNDYKFFVKDVVEDEEGNKIPVDFITINGAHGYAEGLALLLEALGCENLPEVYDVENLDTEAVVKAVLASLANRINVIFANPVEEVVNLLPNLLYFLNANGVAAVVDNLTAALTALAGKLDTFGINLDINSLVNLPKLMGIEDKYVEGDDVISLDNLTISALLKAVSLMTELDLTVLDQVLTGFALGEVAEYDSVSAKAAYKMSYADDFDKHHMVTVIVTAALLTVFETDGNAEKLEEMIGTDIISAIEDVFNSVEITYTAPEWDYALGSNGTVDAMKYSITYPNNWSEATATYVTDLLMSKEFDALVAGLIDANYTSLSALLNDKVNVFTTANLQAIVNAIADLLKDIDDGLLTAAGVLLDVDVVGLKAYKAPEGITTVKAFATELAEVLNTYASGVVEWLLLGQDYRFFVKDVDANGLPVDFITINGAHGYANGLALLLEALGCEDLPAATGETDAIVTGVLTSLANRIDAIFANPVVEVINLLPNLLYFLNTNGVAAVVDNTTAALTALLTKLEAFDVELDINELVNIKKLMKIEDTDATISLDNLAMKDILQAVSYMIDGLDLTLVEDVLVDFALGKIDAYASVSDAEAVGTAKKMAYATEFDKHDMVTVLANIVILTIADEDNAEFVKGLVGEDIYQVILNLLNMSEAEIQEFSWMYKDRVGETFTTLETSDLYNDWPLYGPFYTEEMAAYIADNFGEFVDNILYLLGLEINGVQINTLTQLINELLDGSLYNSSNIIAIRDALAGVLANVEKLEVKGVVVGGYIADVLKTAGIADIKAVAAVEVPEFEKDKEQFVASLCDVLEPLYGILRYVLANQDISFFVDLDKSDLITLKGGEGYRYGIIPLLEVLGCENILTPDAYYAAIKAGDNDTLITSILTPLLARVDKIIENPANEILEILPNIIYFINSNGLDTVVKNTLNAVYSLLGAIEPVAKIDIYELIGVDLAEINMNWLVDKLLGILADAGYDFKAKDLDPIAELTIGTLEKYDSLSGKEAYRMVYTPDGGIEGGKKELVTVILRLLVTFLMHEKNAEIVVDFLSDNLGMSADAKDYLTRLIKSIAAVPTTTYLGMDQALAVIYYLFYSADIGAGETVQGFKDIGAEWGIILNELGGTAPDTIGGILNDLLGDDVIDSDRFAPSGLIGFFQNIINWFNKIINWFKNLFN